jgi:hypothetical protein
MSAVYKSVDPSNCAVYGVGLRPLTSETAGSNPAFDMNAFFVTSVVCFRWRPLRRADHYSREVLPTVLHRGVCSRNLKTEETMARDGNRQNNYIQFRIFRNMMYIIYF